MIEREINRILRRLEHLRPGPAEPSSSDSDPGHPAEPPSSPVPSDTHSPLPDSPDPDPVTASSSIPESSTSAMPSGPNPALSTDLAPDEKQNAPNEANSVANPSKPALFKNLSTERDTLFLPLARASCGMSRFYPVHKNGRWVAWAGFGTPESARGQPLAQ